MRSLVPFFALAFATAAPALATEVIPVAAFHSVQLSGGGEVQLRHGPVQRVTLVEGSRQFTRFRMIRDGQLRIDTCNARCPKHYRMQVLIESPSVPVLSVQGGGLIHAGAGFASPKALTLAVSGGGLVDTIAIPAQVTTAAVSGGGEIRATSHRVLTAVVKGGGSIRYWGNPVVTSIVDGGGNIRRH